MAVALVQTPVVHNPITPETSLPPLQDTFSLPPPWGGTWKDFFSIFQQPLGGLTRTQVLQQTVGDPIIVSSCFQHVIKEAVEAGLLLLEERGTAEEVEISGLKAVKHNYQEKIFLNTHSERLRSILTPNPSELLSVIENFSKLDFQEIANYSGLEVKGKYSERFLDFLGEQRVGQKLYMTHFYKNERVYPDPESCYSHRVIAFFENIIEKSVTLGLLKKELEPDGRPAFCLAPGLHEAISQ